MQKTVSIVAATMLLAACDSQDSVVADQGTQSNFETDEERILYALGVVLGENITEFGLSEAEMELVASGMSDAATNSPYQVDMELYAPQIQMFANERMAMRVEQERAAAVEFADQIAAEPGAERLDSGVVFVPVTEGNGVTPVARDRVSVHYHGTLRDGSVFDSSVDRGSPAQFGLNEVISCWTEGVQRISVGGKARLLCPADTAYGDAGRPGIPGGAALLFEVELLEIL